MIKNKICAQILQILLRKKKENAYEQEKGFKFNAFKTLKFIKLQALLFFKLYKFINFLAAHKRFKWKRWDCLELKAFGPLFVSQRKYVYTIKKSVTINFILNVLLR